MVWHAYSSRIQLPTDTPPQLIPMLMLWARLSRRALLYGCLLLKAMGRAPFSCRCASADSCWSSDGLGGFMLVRDVDGPQDSCVLSAAVSTDG